MKRRKRLGWVRHVHWYYRKMCDQVVREESENEVKCNQPIIPGCNFNKCSAEHNYGGATGLYGGATVFQDYTPAYISAASSRDGLDGNTCQ